jgi:uncharacterized membrane protein YkoI
MKTAILFLATIAAGTSLFAQDDGKLTIDIPAAVQTVINKEKGDGKVMEFRRLNENDGATYAVQLLIDGKNYELVLDAAGRVMRKDLNEEMPEQKPLKIEDLPAAVKKTFLREAAGTPIKEIEKREEKTTYQTEIVVGTRKYLIEVDASGALLTKRHHGDADEN